MQMYITVFRRPITYTCIIAHPQMSETLSMRTKMCVLTLLQLTRGCGSSQDGDDGCYHRAYCVGKETQYLDMFFIDTGERYKVSTVTYEHPFSSGSWSSSSIKLPYKTSLMCLF